MKLKAQHVYDATLAVSQIIRENRSMSQKGKYRLARLHTKLLPEFTVISERRDAMIKAYDTPHSDAGPLAEGAVADRFIVPADKMAEFNAAWKELGDEEIEVDVEPIPMRFFDMGDSVNGALNADEIITLGELVSGE